MNSRKTLFHSSGDFAICRVFKGQTQIYAKTLFFWQKKIAIFVKKNDRNRFVYVWTNLYWSEKNRKRSDFEIWWIEILNLSKNQENQRKFRLWSCVSPNLTGNYFSPCGCGSGIDNTTLEYKNYVRRPIVGDARLKKTVIFEAILWIENFRSTI